MRKVDDGGEKKWGENGGAGEIMTEVGPLTLVPIYRPNDDQLQRLPLVPENGGPNAPSPMPN